MSPSGLSNEDRVWIGNAEFAALVGCSIRTLGAARSNPAVGLIEGRHYQKSHPSGRGKVLWHRDRALAAIEAYRSGNIPHQEPVLPVVLTQGVG